MSRQRLIHVDPHAPHLQRQAGRSLLWTAVALAVLSAVIMLTVVYLSRDTIKERLAPPPPQPPSRTSEEKIQTADQMVFHLFSALSLSEDHIFLQQIPRKDARLEWNETLVTINLPLGIGLHQVENAYARECEFFEPEELTAETVYDSETCLKITLSVEGRITHRLVFHLAPPLVSEEAKPPEGLYRVALVIDDLGENYQSFRELQALGVPITYAILPFQTHTAKIANEIHATRSGDIILHMPLEPWNSTDHPINHGTLLTGMNRDELLEQLEKNIRAVPHLTGVSSHMGSRFTEDHDKMELVLEVLKEKNLLFLDSRTSKKSVGYILAKTMRLKAARRDLFLDNSRDPESVAKQLQKIPPLAKKKGGRLVVIGHPYPDTISALKQYLPLLREQGVVIVPLSELIQEFREKGSPG